MSAGLLNIDDIEQGADWRLLLIFQEIDGTPTNLTGCSLKMQIRSDYFDANGTMVANLSTSTGGITITSAANGTATIAFTAAQTANIAAGNYYHDLFLIDATGTIDKDFTGGVVVLPRVTA